MIVLIPLSRFKITYQIATGRPYSRFENLVLRAIEEGANDVVGLQNIFQIHPRLIIEAVVTLIQAGWVAMNAAEREGLTLSSDGRQALHGGSVPRTLTTESKAFTVVMERLTGGLLPNIEIRYASRRELKGVWKNSLRLRSEITDNRLDQGQVQQLIPRRKTEWLRWVGPIDLDSQGSHWLPVDVDLGTGTTVGLPEVWMTRLSAYVIDEARQFAESHKIDECSTQTYYRGDAPVLRTDQDKGDFDLPRRPVLWSRTKIDPADFIVGSSAHRGYLLAAVSRAKSALAISSAFLNVKTLEALDDALRDALHRGVNVDLLWGYLSGDRTSDKEVVELLRRLAYGARQSGLAGKVRFNPVPTDSHAKTLMFDTVEGQFEGCVGSYNWLSAAAHDDREGNAIEVSVRLHELTLLAALARCIAGLWNEVESDRLGSTSDRWMRIASELEETEVATRDQAGREGEINAQARLVLDREHEALLRDWSSRTTGALLVASHGLGVAARNRLMRLGS